MKIEQSGEPVGEVLSLALAKQHCRVRHSDDDTILQHYLEAAVDWVERACQTVFLETEFTAKGRTFDLIFKGYPNADIQSVTYLDPVGVAGTVTDYEIRDGALYIENAPEISEATVVFKAGLGAGNIPPKLAQACLMLVASFYLHRADVTADMTGSVPMGVKAMVAMHRSFAFA
ncbi:head-tail connector protein [Shinella zoogloeoides]|uniref:head-tail connector protein n=1 Tax=Shinella zoogloeoides TaxID=352475 RepID=UPI00273D028F|nr:head-tail connector protein [Shinella zoogloeoides]WLR94239.1 head-tail connector protein [Shinella zoogloeoides]